MYTRYFGLTQKPFDATPDPRFQYTNRCYREAYAILQYGIRERKGFIALTGEVGIGKTTLLRRLKEGLEPGIKVVMVYNTAVTFDELVEFICGELAIPVEGLSRVGRLRALDRFLLEEAQRNVIVVLLLDEAQNLSPEALENLRLISNLETSTAKLLQIVLVGQPELDAKLALPELRQVTQRIAVRFRLKRLEDPEVEAYIDYRLQKVGGSREALFSNAAIRKLVPCVRGIPRLINIACDNALVLAYATDKKKVSGAIMDSVLEDLRLQPARRAPWRAGREADPATPRRPWREVAVASAVALTAVAAVGVAGPSIVAAGFAALGAFARDAVSTTGPLVTPAPTPAPAPAVPAASPPTTTPAPPAVATAPAPRSSPGAPATATPTTPPPSPAAGVAPAPRSSPDRTAPNGAADPAPTKAEGSGTGRRTAAMAEEGRTLTVRAGSTISGLVFEHYGHHSWLVLDLIYEMNPVIEDLDVVSAGQRLRLPSLTLAGLLRTNPDGSYRLIISSQPTLAAARSLARAAREQGYNAEITTREIAADYVIYRVELSGLKNRAAVDRAWEAARQAGWLDLRRDPAPPTDARRARASTSR
jgi:general secretion pathway protein A